MNHIYLLNSYRAGPKAWAIRVQNRTNSAITVIPYATCATLG